MESWRPRAEGPAGLLHLLLTLSVRLSMALCTKPPMPLVGEVGRSIRLWAFDMVLPTPGEAGESVSGGAKRCESREGSGVPCSGIDIILIGLTEEARVGDPMSTDIGRLRGWREKVFAREGMAPLGEAREGLIDGDAGGEAVISRSRSATVCQFRSMYHWSFFCDEPNLRARRELAI